MKYEGISKEYILPSSLNPVKNAQIQTDMK